MANNKLTIGGIATNYGGVHASSLTGRYKVGWSEHQAFRELLQNMLDGIADTRGVELNEIEGAVCPDDSNRWVFKVRGEEAGFIQCGKDDEVVLMQKDCTLCSSTLYLGSDKDNTKFAGGFGEGYKVGILVLLKKGLQVQYAMEKETWRFEIDTIHAHQQMLVRATPAPANTPPDLVITIRGPGAGKLFQSWRLLVFRSARRTFESKGLTIIHPVGVPAPTGLDSPSANCIHRLVDGPDADPESHAGLVFVQGISIFQHPVLRALGIDLVLPSSVRLTRDRDNIAESSGGCENYVARAAWVYAASDGEFSKYLAARCRQSQIVADFIFRQVCQSGSDVMKKILMCAMASDEERSKSNVDDFVFDDRSWTETQRTALRSYGYVIVDGGPYATRNMVPSYASLVTKKIHTMRIDAPLLHLPTASHKAAYQDVVNMVGLIQRVHAKFYARSPQVIVNVYSVKLVDHIDVSSAKGTNGQVLSVSVDVDLLDLGRSTVFYDAIARGMASALPHMAHAITFICESAQDDPEGFHLVSDQGLDAFDFAIGAPAGGVAGRGVKRSAEDAFSVNGPFTDGAFSIAPVHYYRAQKFATKVQCIKPAATFLPVMCNQKVVVYAISSATLPDVDDLAAHALEFHANLVEYMAPSQVPLYRFAYVPGTKAGFFHNAMMYLNLAALDSGDSVSNAARLLKLSHDMTSWKKTGINVEVFLQCVLANVF